VELAHILVLCAVLTSHLGTLRIGEQLRERDLDILEDLVQAAHALPDRPTAHGSGHEHPLHDRLEPYIELELGPFGETDHCRTEVRWSWHRRAMGPHRAWTPAEVARVEHERRPRVEVRMAIHGLASLSRGT